MTQDNRDRNGGPRNVLYLTEQHDECDEAGCMDLLGADAPEAVDVLFVSFTETAREQLATWRRHADAPPANVGIVSVETGGSSTEGAFGDGGPTVRRVSDPSDLTGVGIAISEFLSSWADNGRRTVVCFDSLTALLQYLDPRRVFQFCNEITSKFETAGATAHFHITPDAHDRQVLSVLASLFDDRVSAADLGYRRDERGPTDEPPSPATASIDDPASPDDPSTADASDESGFVFAGDEFSREATAESSGVQASDGDFVRGGTGDGGPGGDESADGGPGDDGARDEGDFEPTDAAPDVDGLPAETGATGGVSEPVGTDEREGNDVAVEGTEPAEGTHSGAPAGRETTDAASACEPPGAPERSAIGPRSGGEDPGVARSEALLPRTTATVVGVVVMLLLMSFLAAAFPTPLVLDGSDAGDDVGADTVTPEGATTGPDATEATATATATQTEATASSGTATETPPSDTPSTPTETTSGTSSSDSSRGSGVSTPTATTEPVSTESPTETATPTPTPEDDGSLGDTIGDTLDTL